MNSHINLIFILIFFVSTSCNSDAKIIQLLNSKTKEDVILGAYKAGKSGNKKFIPLLLKNADDSRRSTNIRFIGITVYQAKMEALKDILKKDPPIEISYKTDSLVIKFYIVLSKHLELN